MRGHTLVDSLNVDFRATGTAGQPVYFRDRETGKVYDIVATEREVHEDADGQVTHWIVGTEH